MSWGTKKKGKRYAELREVIKNKKDQQYPKGKLTRGGIGGE